MLTPEELVDIEKFIIESKDKKALAELKDDLIILSKSELDPETKNKYNVLLKELGFALNK